MTDVVVSTWDSARDVLDRPMREALSRLDGDTRHWCGYHLGLWDADGTPGPGGGKGIRPMLALLSARAAGAPAEVGVPAAIACELVHNFSLIHDDVMDGDLERRHRPTVWSRFGTSSAILAGDALLALANEILAEASGPTVAWAVRCLNATTRRLIAGQTADLGFESRDDVDLDECIRMAGDKTSALLGCAASLGVVLADGPSELAVGLAEYGEHLGLAFQLVDDLLGIWGTSERTGKPVWSDLRAGKKSLPVVAALTAGTPAARRLAALYTADEALTGDRLAEAAALVEEAGGRAWAEEAVERHSAAATEVLDGLEMPAPVRQELRDLTDKLSRRDY
ncbi:MAG TPA: polyprenyl synthetase family protein [Nocardioidaceae bacterium]|jgi:geranylgeranyl diphosphate synthase type I